MLYKLKYILLLVLIVFNIDTFSQTIPNQWVFGEHAGIDFRTYPPKTFISSINTGEGSAIITDSLGEIIVYTDGITVFNKNHQIIKGGTGLKGSYTSAQSALILKSPKSKNKYYIFTSCGFEPSTKPSTGINFSIVDMSLNNGSGEVIVKNIEILNQACENLTAVKHCNNIDYWIICHGLGTDTLYAFLLNEEGLKNKPVVSNTSVIVPFNFSDLNKSATGEMKPNRTGNILARESYSKNNNFITIFKFDKKNGEAKYLCVIPFMINENPSGIEFSNNDSFLYIGNFSHGNPGIFQYEINLKDTIKMINSKKFISTKQNMDDNHGVSSLCIGPDKKLYFLQTHEYENFLSCIPNPDLTIPKCGIQLKVIKLKANTKSILGLPNIPQSAYSENNISILGRCIEDSFIFVSNICIQDSIRWYINNNFIRTTKYNSLKLYIEKPGWKQIQSIVFNNGVSDTSNMEYYFPPIPEISLPDDTFFCQGSSIEIIIDAGNEKVYWSTGDSNNSIKVNEEGKYYVKVENKYGCISEDSINIKEILKPYFEIEIEPFCEEKPALVTISPENILNNYSVLWSNGEKNSISTTYYLDDLESVSLIDSNNCEFTDTFRVFEQCPMTIFVPNSFSPNGDGLNDVFSAKGTFIESYELKIYNRWGQMIYETTDITQGWDGTYNNQPCPIDAYYYLITTSGTNGQMSNLKGTVMLIR